MHRLQLFQQSMSALENCPQPVIVAMHKGVYGVAIDLCTAGILRTLISFLNDESDFFLQKVIFVTEQKIQSTLSRYVI